MKNIFITISIILGIIPQLMVMWGIYKKTMKLSFSTYFVWFLLNLIISIASIVTHGNYFLSLTYVSLNLIIALMVVYRERTITFPKWEKFVIALSILCMVVWYFTNGMYAIIAAASASFIAGIPQLVVVYKHPELTSLVVWLLGTLAPLFSVFGGANWSIVERFYPTVFFTYGVFGLLILFFKRNKVFTY